VPDIEKRVRSFILDSDLITKGELVLCAVSGGVDSMVLMELLHRFREQAVFEIHVVYFDHGLRGTEGVLDRDFVAAQASSRDLPFTSGRGDVRDSMRRMGRGLEEAARILRYDFLFEVKERIGAGKIATAHHADDQVETILMRLLRGTGLKGLSGIRAKDSRGLIRPLLEISKNDILEFADRNGIGYREDLTNALPITIRNHLRNDILPAIPTEYRDRLTGNILSLSESVREVSLYLEEVIRKVFTESVVFYNDSEIKLDLKKLKGYHYFLRKEVCRHAYFHLQDTRGELSRRSSVALAGFCERGRCGKVLQLPGGVRVLKDFETITLTRKGEIPHVSPSVSVLVEPGCEMLHSFRNLVCRFDVREIGGSDRSGILQQVRSEGGKYLGCFDYEKLVLPLCLRAWRNGDRIKPFGFDGSKKLSDILLEARVPRSERTDVPVLEDRERILWVVGARRSSHAAVTHFTRLVLFVEVSREVSQEDNSNEKQVV